MTASLTHKPTGLPPQPTPMVHLMCGLPSSGKTTFAKELATTRPAIRFTLDAWMIGLYAYTIDMPEYGSAAERCKAVIWDTGLQILTAGRDIILDWSLWSREHRRTWRERVTAAGFQHQLYYFNIPLPRLQTRLAIRNAQRPAGTHSISEAELLRFVPFFEVPSADEGLTIIEVLDRSV